MVTFAYLSLQVGADAAYDTYAYVERPVGDSLAYSLLSVDDSKDLKAIEIDLEHTDLRDLADPLDAAGLIIGQLYGGDN